MRGIRTAGLGLSLAFSSAAAWAQAPAPAAALGPVKVLDAGEPAAVRGQYTDPRAPLPAPRMPYRMQPGTPPVAGGAQFGTPSPAPQPMVTELRDGTGQPVPLGPLPNGYVVPVSPAHGAVMTPPPVFGTGPGYPAGDCEACGPGGGVGGPSLAADPFLGGVGVGAANPLLPRVRGALAGAGGQGRFSLTADYLLWFVKGQNVPPLVTTSSPAFSGILGQGDTRVLYGDGPVNRTLHSGGRFWANYWFPCSQWGLDGGVWFLGRNESNFTADSGTDPLLARPFINGNTGQNFSQLTAAPGLANGVVTVHSETSLWGSEANFRRALLGNAWSRLDGLIGFKNMNLNESLVINERFARVPGSPAGIGAPGAQSGIVEDQFRTKNNFYGLNLGLTGEVRRGRYFANARATVGLGTVYQHGEINGFQQITSNTGTTTQTPGGLLALPNANIGSYNERHFGVMPEVGLTVGYYITPNLRFGVGYNFLYLNSVVRPGNLIDPVIDVTKIPNFPLNPAPAPLGTNHPSAVPFRTSDITVQGLTFSLNWAF